MSSESESFQQLLAEYMKPMDPDMEDDYLTTCEMYDLDPEEQESRNAYAICWLENDLGGRFYQKVYGKTHWLALTIDQQNHCKTHHPLFDCTRAGVHHTPDIAEKMWVELNSTVSQNRYKMCVLQ